MQLIHYPAVNASHAMPQALHQFPACKKIKNNQNHIILMNTFFFFPFLGMPTIGKADPDYRLTVVISNK